ncbi:hypothetical protein ASE74_23255 [Pedobacter sp. Leaf216]|nr:hypothetical protein ASE74_23255 [Pedobacter sp. Leaf216]
MQALIFGYLFIKKKVRASSVAVNRGKPERSESITIPACARMTTVLETLPERLLQLALPQLRNDGFNAFRAPCYLYLAI